MSRTVIFVCLSAAFIPSFLSCSSGQKKSQPGPYGQTVPDGEAKAIAETAKLLADSIRERYPADKRPALRDAHAKTVGCVKAQFTVPELAPDLRVGNVFAQPGQYDAWIRYSNGNPTPQPDSKGDGRGMAIKLMGVPGVKLLENEKDAQTQDFVMINHPVFFIDTAANYLAFTREQLEGKGEDYLKRHLLTFGAIAKATAGKIDNPLETQYWSMAPSRFGEKAMKFSARPCAVGLPPPKSEDSNFLTENMARHLNKAEGCFKFLVQFQEDPAEQPIENPTKEWDTPFLEVAEIRIPKQQFQSEEQMNLCQNLSFTPWHSVPEYQPLGGINRLRKVVYQTISELRHELNGVPPSEPSAGQGFLPPLSKPGHKRVGHADGDVVALEQGWTDDLRQAFYYTPQGSLIMPYSWILHLKQATNENRFIDRENIERFRYLPSSPSSENPNGLPVGWVKDRYHEDALVFDDESDPNGPKGKQIDWLGFTCAACHVSELSYTDPKRQKTTRLRVDGAPTLADMDLFTNELIAALQATHTDQAKFIPFATAILGPADSAEARTALKKQMASIIDSLVFRREINHSKVKYGFGRIDAVGFIFNNVMVKLNGKNKANARDSDAPVSYPFLWGIAQSDVVQWTGFAPNGPFTIGSLIRNAGEVIGVFGAVYVTSKFDFYRSSVRWENLGLLEHWVTDLRSPRWPEDILPPIDRAKAEKGKILYGTYCSECHQVISPVNEDRDYKATITPLDELNTDPKEIENMALKVPAGRYQGKKTVVVAGTTIPAKTARLDPLINAVAGAIAATLEAGGDKGAEKALKISYRKPLDKTISDLKTLFFDLFKERQTPAPGYKGRPMNGVWATAPYLHNGSVPNLYELLLPPGQRSQTFVLGSREFDPVKVGFANKADQKESGYEPFTFDTKLEGNRNTGHEYGTSELTDEQRWQVVEYMKTL